MEELFYSFIRWKLKSSFQNINATLKKIMSPVTSTSVATKGAEDEAGSAPNLF